MGRSVSCGAPFGVGKESAGTAHCLTSRSCDDAPVTTLVLETDHGPRTRISTTSTSREACSCSATGQGEALPPGISSRRRTSRSRRVSPSRSSNSRIASPAAAQPPPAWQLDVAWMAVVEGLRLRWSTSCRSSSAAAPRGRESSCRTSAQPAPSVCCASPFRCSRRRASAPSRGRAGSRSSTSWRWRRSSFRASGMRSGFLPTAVDRRVCLVPGDHSLRNGLGPAAPLLAEWLQARCSVSLGDSS